MSRNIEEIAAESPAVTIDTAGDIQQLAHHLSSHLPAPGQVTNVNIYCSRDTPGRMLCLVDVSGMPAADAARELGGMPFAFTAVVLDVKLPAAFRCRTGRPGHPTITNCNCSSGSQASKTRLEP